MKSKVGAQQVEWMKVGLLCLKGAGWEQRLAILFSFLSPAMYGPWRLPRIPTGLAQHRLNHLINLILSLFYT